MQTLNTSSSHHHHSKNDVPSSVNDLRIRKSFHVIALPRNGWTFQFSTPIIDVIGFQIKDISYASGFSPTTSRLWLESNTLASISNTGHGGFNFTPRNIIASWPLSPEHVNHIDQTFFATSSPKRFNRMDFSIYDHTANLIPFVLADEVQITIEFTHSIQQGLEF